MPRKVAGRRRGNDLLFRWRVEAAMDFPGFEAADFEVFHIPDFAARMGAIRSQLRPKLVALASDLAGPIEELTGIPTFPHAAQHMRRRVNPPPETWAAFCRDRKGYKRWTHYRVAVSAGGVRATVFVEDDADDKALFASALSARGRNLRAELGEAPVLWYTFGDDPVPNAKLTQTQLREEGRRLARLKGLKFQAGIELDAASAARMPPAEFESFVMRQFTALRPLYLAGASGPGP